MRKMRLLIGSVVAMAILVTGGLMVIPHANASDCSGDAVIKCGFNSISNLRSKYNSQSTPGINNIYNYFGLTSNVINHGAYKVGTVTKTGSVIVDGKTVATHAYSAGRYLENGGTKHVINGTTFYVRPTTSSFGVASIQAIVFFNPNGTFLGAALFDCGNSIGGTPVPPPKPPVYQCTSLKAVQGDRTTFTFTTSATAQNGATIKDYTYNFGDGSSKTTTASTTHAYTNPGTYTVTVAVNVNVNGKTVVAPGNCKTTVTVTPEMCTIPGKEQYPKNDSRCVEDCASVSITKTVNNKAYDEVDVNQSFEYEITVKNTGNVALTNLKVTDPSPTGITMLSASKGDITGNVWSYTIPSLAVGASETFTINAKYPAFEAGTQVNQACVDTSAISKTHPSECATASTSTHQNIQVCDTNDDTVKTIDQSEYDASHMTTDLSKCAPVTPPELPHTGTELGLGSLIGAGSLTGVVLAYVASRRNLR